MIGSLAVENLLGLSLKNLASLSTWGGGGGGGGGGGLLLLLVVFCINCAIICISCVCDAISCWIVSSVVSRRGAIWCLRTGKNKIDRTNRSKGPTHAQA